MEDYIYDIIKHSSEKIRKERAEKRKEARERMLQAILKHLDEQKGNINSVGDAFRDKQTW